MSPAEVDTVLAIALAADLPVEACDVEVPWFYDDGDDALLCGHVDTDGTVTRMRFVLPDGREREVAAEDRAIARADLRDAAVELWGRR